MALKRKQACIIEALVLQCAFGSLGMAWGPTVGEVNKFIIKWSKIGASTYQVQNVLNECVARGWIYASEEKIGTRKRRHYDISNCGVMALLSMNEHINPSFLPLMDFIGCDAFTMVAEKTAAFLAQGGPNGIKK